MNRDVEGPQKIHPEEAIHVCDKRDRMTEDRKILDDFPQAVKTSQPDSGDGDHRIHRPGVAPLLAGGRIITGFLKLPLGKHGPRRPRIDHKPGHCHPKLALKGSLHKDEIPPAFEPIALPRTISISSSSSSSGGLSPGLSPMYSTA
jgi:hypothetical protein